MTKPAVATNAPAWLAVALLRRRRVSGFAFDKQRAKENACPSPGDTGSKSNDVYQALIASGIFSRTDPAVVAAWSKQLEPVRFSPGHAIVEDGDIAGRLYVVVWGKVKVSRRRSHNCELVLNILGRSDIFGAVALFGSNSPELCATALTDGLAVPIRRDQLRAWMAEHPEIGSQMLRLMARWTKTMTDCLVDFTSADAQVRLANRLLFLRKRFGRREGEAVRVVHDLTLEDFSLLVGAASETVGATLRDFEDRGWIRFEDNSLVILDAQALMSVRPMSESEVCCA
jgi:CRP/FNR family transcriptional regulator, cyclic AMP receptor protein